MRDAVRQALAIGRSATIEERTIDITTTGRRSGEPRRIEICSTGRRFHLPERDTGSTHAGLAGQLDRRPAAHLPPQARRRRRSSGCGTVITDPAEPVGSSSPSSTTSTIAMAGQRRPKAVLEEWVEGSPLARVSFVRPTAEGVRPGARIRRRGAPARLGAGRRTVQPSLRQVCSARRVSDDVDTARQRLYW